MAKKYSLKQANNHFIRKGVFEKISIWIERFWLTLKDQQRFFKIDKIYIWETIKELVSLFVLCIIINAIGSLLLGSSCFRNLIIIRDIINNSSFIIENYNQYLIACLGVAGFLAGLFLSNLSSIITSRYSNIVSKVSLSVLNEYTNKKYFKSIINYLCLIIIQLSLWFLNLSINPLLSLATVFLTIKIILIYFDLARRVFMFSNINALTRAICHEIDLIFNHLAIAIKFNKSDSVFYSYSRQLLANINILDELQNEFIKEKDYDSLCDFTNCILNLCVHYSKVKNIIPKNSYWFASKYEANNWFEADPTEVNLRTMTGTFISNKQVKDYYFIENYIKSILNNTVNFLIQNNEIDGLYKIIIEYNSCIDSVLINCGDFEYWNSFNNELEDYIFNSDIKENEEFEGLVDTLSLNKITFVLRSEKYVSDAYEIIFANGFSISKVVDKTNTYLQSTNEIIDINNRLQFEKKIEKKYITPDSYAREYYAFYFIKNVNLMLDILSKNYDRFIEQAKKLSYESNDISSCLFYSRIIEYENKLKNAVCTIKKIYDSILNYKNNYDFDKLNESDLLNKISLKHYINLTNYAKVFIHMDKYNFKEDQIDFCGALFYSFSEAVFETILEDDYSSFELIYDTFVSLCFKAEEFIYGNLDKEYNQNYLISKYKIPMVMYMNLNGYIIYHSHLTSDERWQKKVEENFNKIIKLKNSYDILKRLAAIASLEFGSFDMNDFVLNLSQRYSNHLKSNNLIKTKYSSDSFYARKIVDTDDELISKFTSINFDDYVDFYHKFYEIFVILYVNPNLEDCDKYETSLKLNNRGDENE